MTTGRFARSYSPVTSVEVASQSGTSNHSNPKAQTQFGQSVRSLFRFRQVGDDHLRSYKEGEAKTRQSKCIFKLTFHSKRSGAHQV